MRIPENKLSFFKRLFDRAIEKGSNDPDALTSAYKQYRGELSLGERPAQTVRNITYELIESEISTDIPIPKVSAYQNDDIKRKNARRIEALLSGLRDSLPYEKMNDSDERMTYVYGSSLFLVEWAEEENNGTIKLTHLSPMQFLPQPDAVTLDDMEYCFLTFRISRDELFRSYRLNEEDAVKLIDDEDDDTAETIVTFYKDDDGRIGRFIFSGDTVLSDIPDFYARKREICTVCQKDVALCTCGGKTKLINEGDEILNEDIVLADGKILSAGSRIRRFKPKRFPLVIRKNTSFEESLFGQSDCFFIRAQQLEINKVLSRVHEKMMMSGLYPYKPDGCQFRYDNSIGGKVLNLRPGEIPSMFGVLDTSPDIMKDLTYVEAIYRDAKRILGISDAYVGEGDSLSVSGRSRAIQVAQAEGRLASKRVMKNAAYAELDRLIFEFYLAYADKAHPVIVSDSLYKASGDAFCRYDFLKEGEDGIYDYDDDYHFSVDTEKPSRDEREPLWQHNLENYRAGGFGPLGEKESLARYWAAQADAAYPGAKKHLLYFS